MSDDAATSSKYVVHMSIPHIRSQGLIIGGDRGSVWGFLDWGAIHYCLAHLNVRSGNRRRALRHFVSASIRGEWSAARDLAWLVRRQLNKNDAAEDSRADPEIVAWRAEAEVWLRPGSP